MHPRTVSFLASLLILSTFSPSTLAQLSSSTSPVIYVLSPQTTYHEGCYDPCDCILRDGPGVLGTFKLTPQAPGPAGQTYTVSDVRWTVPWGSETLAVTGSGTYFRSSFVARAHRLTLDLQIGTNPVMRLDSGWVPDTSRFPQINITISHNNMVCYDYVFDVVARPARASEITRYTLIRGTTWQEGCFPPCLCPLLMPQPVAGRFDLVLLQEGPLFTQYAVLNFDARVLGPIPGGPPTGSTLRGAGRYQVGGEVAVMQQMVLDISVNGGSPIRLDSRMVAGGHDFPNIDILLSVNNLFCYDRVLDLHARPLLKASTADDSNDR